MLILASKSPRRREILQNAGFRFSVRTHEVPEVRGAGETPESYVRRLARDKALAVERRSGEIVLAADTVVVVDGEVLEKPVGAEDAARMLASLSGRRHQVITGICLLGDGLSVVDHACTEVYVSELTSAEIDVYVASGEPADKAGAYAIQGLASKFVERIDGCHFNVVGLPVALVYRHLRAAGAEALRRVGLTP